MKTIASTKTIRLAGTAVLAVASLSAVVGISLTHSKKTQLIATGEPVILDHSCAPTLSSGAATQLDVKGVTWEYSNCADSLAGHVQVNHQGYFGVSASSAYGFTGITEITVTFSPSTDCELWLLKSVNGTDWHEEKILTTDEAVTGANGWRYIRLYNWSNDNTAVDVESVSISYSCSGVSSTDDVDAAVIGNVVEVTSNLTYQTDTENVSPLGDSTSALTFTKTGASGTEITLSLGKTYTIGEIAEKKVEYDLKATNVDYGKTIQLIGDSYAPSKINSKENSGYKITNIQDDWWHIEVPVSCIISLNSGYDKKDVPASGLEQKEINRIKINHGSCTIDNLKIGSDDCELGNFNKPEGTGAGQWQPTIGEIYWLKTSWVGVLHPELCQMTVSDSTLARHIPITDPNLKHGSPFYFELLAAGSVTITATVVSGYNRRSHTIVKTISIV